MLDVVVKNLAAVLKPEDTERARQGYAFAITHIGSLRVPSGTRAQRWRPREADRASFRKRTAWFVH